VAGDGDDLRAGELGEVFHFAEARAGEHRFREPLRRQAEMLQRRAGPLGRVHIEELRGARDGELVFHAARQQVVEIVGQKETARREVGDGGTARDGFLELQRGVVKHVRNARRA
jgi:hypothetical protein